MDNTSIGVPFAKKKTNLEEKVSININQHSNKVKVFINVGSNSKFRHPGWTKPA